MGTHVITGANGGIGKATVHELKKREQSVVSIARTDADLSSMHEINSLADNLLAQHDALDGLLLNAGGAWRTRIQDHDLTLRLQVNNLAGKDYWYSAGANALQIGAPRTISFNARIDL